MPIEKKSRGSFGRVTAVGAMVLVCLAGPLVGVVHTPIVIAMFGASAALLIFSVIGRLRRKQNYSAYPLFMLPFGIGAVLAFIRLVPLPDGARTFFMPHVHERVAWVLSALPDVAQAEAFSTLSVDPGVTAVGVLRLFTGLFIAVVVANATLRQETRLIVSRGFIIAGVVLFLVSMGHLVANEPLIWGVFRPTGRTPIAGPLVNPNQLGRAYGVFAILSIGHALTQTGRNDRIAGGLVGLICTIAMFLTLSRGAAVAFAAAGIFAALLWMRVGKNQKYASKTARVFSMAALPAAAVIGMAFTAYLAQDKLVEEVAISQDETLATSKAALYPPTLRLISATAGVGVGVGGFESNYAAFVETGELHNRRYSHAENIILQALADHGVAVGLLLLLLALFISFRWFRHLRDKSDVAPLAGMVFLVFGDLFDFVLEVGFGVIVAGALLGVVAGKAMARNKRRVPVPPRYALAGATIATLIGGVVIPVAVAERPSVLKSRVDASASQETLELALAHRPLNGYIAYRLAVKARERNDVKSVLKWANRAMVLWPNLGGAHVEAARALIVTGRRDQGFLEYRVASETRSLTRGDIHSEVARVARTIDELRIGVEGTADAWTNACRTLRTKQRWPLAQACVDHAAEHFPESSAAVDAITVALTRQDLAGAQARYDKHFKTRNDGDALALRARLLELRDGTQSAYAEATTWTEQRPYAPFLRWRLRAAMKIGRHSDALRLIERLKPLASGPRMIDELDQAQLKTFHGLDAPGKALKVAEQIVRRRPDNVRALITLAQLQLRLGLVKRAEITHRRAREISRDNPMVKKLGEQVRAGIAAELKANATERVP